MKLKGLTKLALSGVALAAVAATLGTSTYAWYVTNSSATVTGVQGTAQAGGLGNVLVAQKSTASGSVNGHGSFEKTQALSNENFDQTSTTAGLVPYTPVSAATYTSADPDADPAVAEAVTSTPATLLNASTKWVDSKGKELETGKDGKAYIDFDVWILSTDATSIQVNITLENTTTAANVPTQIAYAATGIPTATKQGEKFSINIVEALRIGYTQYNYTAEEAAATTASNGTELTTSTIFDNTVVAAATGVADGATFTSSTGADAHDYYHAVLGGTDAILTTGPTINGTKTTKLTVTKGVESRLHFYVWLEGTDAQCFDSCSGQSFKIGLEFVANKEAGN